MKYKLAIFDLDGTILDTLEDLTDSVNYALCKWDMPQRTLDEVRKFVGNGIRLLIERAVIPGTDKEKTDKVFEDFKVYYQAHCQIKTKPYDGILDTINKLKKAGLKVAVVSNKADGAVQILCKHFFNGQFDSVVGERENVRRKPSPDSVNQVLKELGINREDAVYIGDSDVDIMTAKNAEMDCISVDWGFRSKEFLLENGAGTIVESTNELQNKLGV